MCIDASLDRLSRLKISGRTSWRARVWRWVNEELPLDSGRRCGVEAAAQLRAAMLVPASETIGQDVRGTMVNSPDCLETEVEWTDTRR